MHGFSVVNYHVFVTWSVFSRCTDFRELGGIFFQFCRFFLSSPVGTNNNNENMPERERGGMQGDGQESNRTEQSAGLCCLAGVSKRVRTGSQLVYSASVLVQPYTPSSGYKEFRLASSVVHRSASPSLPLLLLTKTPHAG